MPNPLILEPAPKSGFNIRGEGLILDLRVT